MKLRVRRAGVRDLLKAPGVAADLETRARRIADAAGSGHRVDLVEGRVRARASVVTETTGARRAEAERRTLTRAVDAGR